MHPGLGYSFNSELSAPILEGLKDVHSSWGIAANVKKFTKFSVQVRLEILLEKFVNACGLQHFCITWIYLVQNAVYKEFNKFPMIDGMAIATCLIDCQMNTMIKRWSHSHSSLEYLFCIPTVHEEYTGYFWRIKIQALD